MLSCILLCTLSCIFIVHFLTLILILHFLKIQSKWTKISPTEPDNGTTSPETDESEETEGNNTEGDSEEDSSEEDSQTDLTLREIL